MPLSLDSIRRSSQPPNPTPAGGVWRWRTWFQEMEGCIFVLWVNTVVQRSSRAQQKPQRHREESGIRLYCMQYPAVDSVGSSSSPINYTILHLYLSGGDISRCLPSSDETLSKVAEHLHKHRKQRKQRHPSKTQTKASRFSRRSSLCSSVVNY